MFVARYPEWLAQIEFRDHTTAVFDGPKDMFKYYFNLETYNPMQTIADIIAIVVTDYYTVEAIDGRKAWYVLGSDVYGPMGREMIPFSSKTDAEEFMKDHSGREIVSFEKFGPAVLKQMD